MTNYLRKDRVLSILHDMLRNGPLNAHNGICEQLQFYQLNAGEFYTVKKAMHEWPYYSGALVFPVPSTMQPFSAPACYIKLAEEGKGGLWRGDQLMYRRSLLRHLIRAVDAWD